MGLRLLDDNPIELVITDIRMPDLDGFDVLKRNTNQSKFHWGHPFAGLGLLGLDGWTARLFPLWVSLLNPAALGASADYLPNLYRRLPFS